MRCLHMTVWRSSCTERVHFLSFLYVSRAPLSSQVAVNVTLPATPHLTGVSEWSPLLTHTMRDGFYDRQRLRDTSISNLTSDNRCAAMFPFWCWKNNKGVLWQSCQVYTVDILHLLLITETQKCENAVMETQLLMLGCHLLIQSQEHFSKVLLGEVMLKALEQILNLNSLNSIGKTAWKQKLWFYFYFICTQGIKDKNLSLMETDTKGKAD